jgi:hypothetical protein
MSHSIPLGVFSVFSAVRSSGTLILLIEIEFLTRQVGRQVRGSEPSGLFGLRLRL